MKKVLSIAAAALLTVSLAAPALAHGSHAARTQGLRYSVCRFEDCVLEGLHTHENKAYFAHYYGDGHRYHSYCSVADCTAAGYHAHDGSYCFAYPDRVGQGGHHQGGQGGGHH